MSHRGSAKRTRPPGPAAVVSPFSRSGTDIRPLLLGALAALVVTTPLLPSEAAVSQGTHTLPILAWLLLLLAATVGVLLSGPSKWRWASIDTSVAVFFVLYAASAVYMASFGQPRATINALWQAASLGCCFFLTRQIIRSARETRGLLAVMIALAVGLSAFALYQYFYSLPLTRAQYEQAPEVVLREAGIDAAPDSTERQLFKDRLYSSEPAATFALTNSLAGMLAPWLVVVVGIGLAGWVDLRDKRRIVICSAALGVMLGFCLVLTKSRSAWLATAAGIAWLIWAWQRGGRRMHWMWLLAIASGGLVVVALIATAASLDWLVLSETPKSISYRLEYWQASFAMIADYPWSGCGPGNFQQYYAAYKLPQASEMIADPHNFLVELIATAGIPASVAFAAIMILAGRHVLNVHRRSSPAVGIFGTDLSPETMTEDAAIEDIRGGPLRWIYGGAALGLLLAFPFGAAVGFTPDPAILVTVLPAGGLALVLSHRWVRLGRLPFLLPIAAVAVLLINLLAAGGFSFAGVAQNGWLLLAIVVGMAEEPSAWKHVTRRLALALIAVAILLVVLCHQSLYLPILKAQTRMGQGLTAESAGQLELAEAGYFAAADADPRAVEPWMQLASLYQRRILVKVTPESIQQFDRAVQQIRRLDPRSYTSVKRIGDWRLAIYDATEDIEQLQLALEAYRRSVQLYPSGGLCRTQLAWAEDLAGNRAASRREATEALRLDALTPHREKKLKRQRIYDPTGRLPSGEDAEQVMRRLRK